MRHGRHGRDVADGDVTGQRITDGDVADCRQSQAVGAPEVRIHAAEFANRIARFQVGRIGGNGRLRRGHGHGNVRLWAVGDGQAKVGVIAAEDDHIQFTSAGSPTG